MFNIVSLLAKAFKYATALMFGTTGEIVGQKGGHLNMGIPGVMYMGALGGILGTRIYLDALNGAPINPFLIIFIPILFSILFGALTGALFSFFTVTLHCNQNVTGLTITTFGVGLACYFIGGMNTSRMSEAGLMIQSLFKGYEKAGWFGSIFLGQSFYSYLAVIVAIVALLIITRTRIGLNLRAVGENPASANAAGISVNTYRYLATIIGCGIAAIGGLAYEMDFLKGMFNVADQIDSLGWLALCLVIFSFWNPVIGLGCSYLIGILSTLSSYLPFFFKGQIFFFRDVLPYAITIVVLIISSIFSKKGGLGPEGLGQSYFKEER